MSMCAILSAALDRSKLTGFNIYCDAPYDLKYDAVLENEMLAIHFSYDWRDRLVGVVLRSKQREAAYRASDGFGRLAIHDNGSVSLALLLSERSEGRISGNPAFPFEDEPRGIETMTAYLDAIAEFAPEVISGQILSREPRIVAPVQYKIYRNE